VRAARPRDAQGPARAKVELRVEPPAPKVPSDPPSAAPSGSGQDVVTEAVQALPAARSRRAKTEVRLPNLALGAYLPGATPEPTEFGTPGSARTVGGRTERLSASDTAPYPGGSAGSADTASVDPAAVGQILTRTIGGRTERGLPGTTVTSDPPPTSMLALQGPSARAPSSTRWLVVAGLAATAALLTTLVAIAVWRGGTGPSAASASGPESPTQPTATPTSPAAPAESASAVPTADTVASASSTASSAKPPSAAGPRGKTRSSTAPKVPSDLLFP
jgi:hypothetical protein